MTPRLPVRRLSATAMAAAALALAATPADAHRSHGKTKTAHGKRSHFGPFGHPGPFGPFGKAAFGHVGTFTVADNLRPTDPADTATSSEIIDATPDGRTLIYTDSPTGRIGFVDITNPSAPAAKGALDVGGEPTSIKTFKGYALVAVNTSPSYAAPSGKLVIVDVASQTVIGEMPLAGQPDSIDVSPSGRYAAIVIENERDEDLNGGLLPQLPAGTLQVLRLSGPVGSWASKLSSVDLTGIAGTAPEDPEPEFVDINRKDEAVVSLQENNHLAIVDLRTGKVKRHFTAGTVSLSGIDGTEEELGPQGNGLIELSDAFTDRRREPDAVHWIDDHSFATANEGDYEDANGQEGGTRTATIFSDRGTVLWDSGTQLEYDITRAGQFPMGRAENKGVEPEGLEVVTIAGRTYMFVGEERSNTAAVYEITRRGPQFQGVLPTGIGPEGLRAIGSRGLFVVAAEEDDPEGPRSLVTIYQLQRGAAPYPQLVSADDAAGKPIPWVAISGLSGDSHDPKTMWAVSDSALAQPWLYKVDVRRSPAVITERIPIGAAESADQHLGEFDLEGVAARPEGGFWLASEGRTNSGSSRPNLIIRTDAAGTVLQSIELPAAVVAGATSSGFEGVSVTGSEAGGDETVYVAIQREWADDPAGTVKLGKYDVASGEWTFVRYPLGAVESPAGGWIGLSEITVLGDGHTALIVERDNQIGRQARVKRLFRVDLTDPSVQWKPFGEPLETVSKTLFKDVIGDLDAHSITVPDKLEGVGVTKTGKLFLATDNDALDDNYGETLFFDLGRLR